MYFNKKMNKYRTSKILRVSVWTGKHFAVPPTYSLSKLSIATASHSIALCYYLKNFYIIFLYVNLSNEYFPV